MNEKKDWSKATDDELIAEAKRRYPVGTTIQSPYGTVDTVTFGFFMIKQSLCLKTTGPSCIVYSSMMNQWAEILSQPKEASPEVQKYVEANNPEMSFGDKKFLDDVYGNSPEPKAGDMVEAADLKDFSVAIVGYFTGGKDKRGRYICEVNELGELFAYNFIRLPRKSEVESKAKELNEALIADNGKDAYYRLLDAIKWGQQNKDAK